MGRPQQGTLVKAPTHSTLNSTGQAMKFLLFLLVINTSIATGVQGRNINIENTTGMVDSEGSTELTTASDGIDDLTTVMDEKQPGSSDVSTLEQQLDMTTRNPGLQNKVVTEPSTTASVTNLSDPVKQNILKMFTNLLESDLHKNTRTDAEDDEEDIQTITTPMTTPNGRLATTSAKSTTTQAIPLTTKDTIKTSDHSTKLELATLSTFGADTTTAITLEITDTQPSTTETLHVTKQREIKDPELTTNQATSTTISSGDTETTTIIETITETETEKETEIEKETEKETQTEKETEKEKETETDVKKEIDTEPAQISFLYTTEKTMMEVSTEKMIGELSEMEKHTTTIMSTTAQHKNIEVDTTITIPTEPSNQYLEEETEEPATRMNIPITDILDKKTVTKKATASKENAKDISTDWFYPTTKPSYVSLYSIEHDFSLENTNNSVLKLNPHGSVAPSKSSEANFPWIFPKWIADPKLHGSNQRPRLI